MSEGASHPAHEATANVGEPRTTEASSSQPVLGALTSGPVAPLDGGSGGSGGASSDAQERRAHILLRAKQWWFSIAPGTIPVMAAALAYRTIFSLIPALMLGLLVFRLFGNSEELVRNLLRQILDLTGLEQLMMAEDDSGFNLTDWLNKATTGFSSIKFAGIGIVSGLTLMYAAISLIVETETCFNSIYGVQRGRSWASRISRYWLAVSIGPLLIYASFLAGDWFKFWAEQWGTASGGVVGPLFVTGAGYLVSVGISGVLLVLVYTIVPNTRVSFKAAAVGGVAAALVLELAKYGFGFYVSHAGYKSLYGSLALLPLFLLWVYLTWFIVLMGLRVTYLAQHRGSAVALLMARAGANADDSMCIQPGSAAVVVKELAKRFAAGRGGADAIEIATNTGLDPLFVRKVLDRCEREGIVIVSASSRRGGRYVLNRPPELIAMSQLVQIGRSTAIRPFAPGARELLEQLARNEDDGLKGKTLADFMAKSPTPERGS